MFASVDYDPFASGGEVLDFVETTEAQREILITIELGGKEASLSYNEATVTYFDGALDLAIFREAFAQMVSRHPALRSAFSEDGRFMTVLSDAVVNLDHVDLGELDAETIDQRLDELSRAEVCKPFDLRTGPVARATLVRVEPSRHAFFFTAHHVVYDGWSAAVVLADLAEAYSAGITGRQPTFSPAFSFFDYAREENEYEKSVEFERVRTYWANQYREPVPYLDLPRDGQATNLAHSSEQYRAKRHDHALAPELVDSLRAVAREQRCSLFVLLTAAYAAHLCRVTGQNDFSVCIPAAGQNIGGHEFLVGHCVYTLPLRLRVDREEPFLELLSRVRTTILEALEHQRVSMGRLVQELRVERTAGRVPLAVTSFNLDTGLDNVAFEGLSFEFHSIPRDANSYEISINVSDAKHAFVIECSYWSALYSEATIACRMREYETLLRDLAQAPRRTVAALRVLSEDDRRRVVTEWNDTARDYIHPTFLDAFGKQVAQRPDAPCVVYAERVLRYAEVDERSSQLADCLRKRGVSSGTRVAVCMDRSEWMPIVLIAIFKAGASYVPIDIRYPVARMATLLADAGARHAVVSRDYAGSILATKHVPARAVLCVDQDRSEILQSACEFESPAPSPDDLAYVIYTSGSTGKPKGVPIHHGALANFTQAFAERLRFDPDYRVLAVATVAFDQSVHDFFVPLVVGASVVVAPDNVALEEGGLARLVSERDINLMSVTASTWRLMVEQGWKGKADMKAISAGEAIAPDFAASLRSLVGELWNGYGPTETTVMAVVSPLDVRAGRVLIGRPIGNYRTYVLDEAQRPVPAGVSGELCIAGPSVARGYLNRESLSAERFLPEPFSDQRHPPSLMYRTGDRARWSTDGVVEYLGRFDNQVKVRGYRIELGEIEHQLENVSGVLQAVTRVVPDERGDLAIIAYIRTTGEQSEERLRKQATEHLLKNLPSYMLPTQMIFLESFPIGTTGKVDRAALPLPTLSTPAQASGVLRRARTPVEEVISEIWATVLGKEVSTTDNFFENGGHSLHAIEIVRLAADRGLHLAPADVLRRPTVAQLAQAVRFRVADGGSDAGLIELSRHGERAPLIFLHSVPGDLLHYGPLVGALEKERPILGFEGLSAVDKIPATEWSIDRLAAHYAAILSEHRLQGTVHLGGWCFGGTLAMALALQLRQRGVEVGKVVLMECWPTRSPVRELARKARLFIRSGREALPIVQRKMQRSFEPVVDPTTVFALDVNDGPFQHRSEVYRRNMAALDEHRSKRYDGSVVLIKTGLQVSHQLEEPDYGWKGYVDDLVVEDIDAPHKEILQLPNVTRVAQIITSELRRFDA